MKRSPFLPLSSHFSERKLAHPSIILLVFDWHSHKWATTESLQTKGRFFFSFLRCTHRKAKASKHCSEVPNACISMILTHQKKRSEKSQVSMQAFSIWLTRWIQPRRFLDAFFRGKGNITTPIMNLQKKHYLSSRFETLRHEQARNNMTTQCNTQTTQHTSCWAFHGNLRVPSLCHPPRK